tara:strand:+ start:506 stop:1783 length:1278 start_codon:yes stop_codon:yes gene_type:complete
MNKNCKIFFVIIMFMFSCFSDRISETTRVDDFDKFLHFDISQKDYNETSNSIHFRINFPTNKLVFNKVFDHFYSDITIDLVIVDVNNNIVLSDSWNENIIENYYDDTKSFEDVVLEYDTILPIGSYNLNIMINDFKNHINWINYSDFEVIKNNGLGDIEIFYKEKSLYKKYELNKVDKIIPDTLWLGFKVNNTDLNTNYAVSEIEYLNIIFDEEFLIEINSSKNEKVDFFKYEKDYIDYIKSEELVDEDKIVIEDFSINKMEYIPIIISDYSFNLMKINMYHEDETRTKILNFIDFKNFEYDMSLLIGPMYYLLGSRYYEFEILNIDEKIEYIKKYWDEIENSQELLREFYTRIIYSNKNFDYLSTEGWDTDRGRIHIINGHPEKISYEFDNQSEYIIWEYPNKHYVFINIGGYYELYDPNVRSY